MDYDKLENFVSKPRLDRYLVSCGNSKERAKNLYEANIMLCQAFYPVLNLFETFLRNSINDKLSSYFTDDAWIINQKAGFMSDPSLAPKYGLKSQIINAENNTRGTITPGKIVSEQTFGFWTSFFDRRHYRLIRGHVIHCFPHKPSTINKDDIANMLRDIREFRNRIYHNEAICFNNITIDFAHAKLVKDEIYKLLEWMDVDLKAYVKQFDDIDSKIASAMTV
jgi:hypothetical protein